MGFLKKVSRSVTKPVSKVTKPITKPINKVVNPVAKNVVKPVMKPIRNEIVKPIVKPIIKPINKALSVTDKLGSAAADLVKKASPKPLSQCARYVRLSLKKYGIDIDPTKYAKDYAAKLIKAGFKEIDPTGGYLVGDIVIFPSNAKHPSGHMQMYTKNGWYSDFKQIDIYPGPHYRSIKSPYKVYRLK